MKIIITFIIAAFVLPTLAAEETGVSNNSKSIHFGGPSSVPGQVSSDREKSKLPVFKELLDLQAYYDFKESLTHDHGFTFGLDYNMLYQYATPSNTESDAAGGVFRAIAWGQISLLSSWLVKWAMRGLLLSLSVMPVVC